MKRAGRDTPKVVLIKYHDQPNGLETRFTHDRKHRERTKRYATYVLNYSSNPAMVAVAKSALETIKAEEAATKLPAPPRRKAKR